MMKTKYFTYMLCLLMAFSMTASAGTLSVGGSRFEAEIIPGDHITHEITVNIAEDDEPVDVKAGVFGYGLSLEGSKQPLGSEDDLSPYSAADFLEVTPTKANLKPGEPTKFVLEGEVPVNVGTGGRYALVKIETDAQGSGKVGVITAIVIPVRLTISGSDIIETGEITDLKVSDEKVSAIFENTGNHHYLASAEAVIKDKGGDVVANYSIPLQIDPLIPTTSRLFDILLDQEMELPTGSYTVEVSVIHEDGTVLDTEETTFEV